MIMMTGLIIAIKDNGSLAVSSIAAPICVSHNCMCHKGPLICSLLGLTNFIDR